MTRRLNRNLVAETYRLMLIVLMCMVVCCVPACASETENAAESVILILPENATEFGIPVETQYATFFFPEEYAGKLQFVLMEMEEGSMMIASTFIGDTEYELYYLSMGQIEMDGVRVGALQADEADPIEIYLMPVECEEDMLSEEELSYFYAVQESMNLILEQLMEDPRYIAE